MIDYEVERLRRLRGSALRVRAVAGALARRQKQGSRVIFELGCGAAWRVARAVTGRLRAHPNADYQRDAGVGILIRNSLVATAASLGASRHSQAMEAFGRQLQSLLRQLEDARAVTWAADLSDTFGRSQREIRALVAAVRAETYDVGGIAVKPIGLAGSKAFNPASVTAAKPAHAALVAATSTRGTAPVEGDWPFLTI